MPTTTHVTSLELSRRLKELGVEQNSLFYWHTHDGTHWQCDQKDYNHRTVPTTFSICSAYLASELGEMLWQAFEKSNWKLLYTAYGNVFNFPGTNRIGELGIINLMRRPDMAAKMLIYLIENHLISVEELGK